MDRTAKIIDTEGDVYCAAGQLNRYLARFAAPIASVTQMANRAYLLAVNNPNTTWTENATEEIIAEGINEIPVFWASLFTESDRQLDTYNADDGNIEIPNWCVPSNVAKERLAALATPISELLDERSKEIWSLWVRHLTAESATYFKTNASEVWGLDPDGYDAYMKTMLEAFAKPSPSTMAAAVEANELTYADSAVSWDDDEETICKLAGANHIRDVPWHRLPPRPSVTGEEPPPSWVQARKFEKQTGLPYFAADLVMVVVSRNEGMLERPFSLHEMLLAILDYYKQIGLDSAEMVDDLRDNGLKTPEDLIRTLLGLKEIGSPISYKADSKSSAAATIVKQLFPEQNEG